jgi:hypothetical protein
MGVPIVPMGIARPVRAADDVLIIGLSRYGSRMDVRTDDAGLGEFRALVRAAFEQAERSESRAGTR